MGLRTCTWLVAAGSLAILVVLISGSTGSKLHAAWFDGQQALFEKALAQHGLELADVRIDQADEALWGGDKYRLSLLTVFQDNPWKISSYSRSISGGMLERAADWPAVLGSCHKRTDAGVRLGLGDDVLAPYRGLVEEHGENSLAVALSGLSGKTPESFMQGEAGGMDAYATLPPAVRDAAALWLFALPDVLEYRRLGLVEPLATAGLDIAEVEQVALDYLISEEGEAESTQTEDTKQALLLERVLESIDRPLLNAGAFLLALSTAELQSALAGAEDQIVSPSEYIAATDYGALCIKCRALDDYYEENYLLLLDLSGNDAYFSAAAASSALPVSVAIDLAGSDTYSSSGSAPQLAAGICGYGILLDCAGDDVYTSRYAGQGCGVLGSGVLVDSAGDDTYTHDQLGQGAGAFGTGMLIDTAGSDEYALYTYGQGYGYTLGCGLLLDSEGSDRYTGLMEPAQRANGGPFGTGRFIHFAQGAGYGRRADYTDGHSWAGGIGLLIDGGGNDEYQCEVYGQGTGYWYSLGLCIDKGGDDTYHGGWYSLGGSPHFGVGVLQDDAGDDRYVLSQMQSIGNGRDYSIGWFEDSSGDDWYQGSVMTLGVGDVNGIGVFWDKSGADTYLGKGPCFGQARMESAGSMRDGLLTLGLFIDGGGQDGYYLIPGDATPTGTPQPEITSLDGLEPHPVATNGAAWVRGTDRNEVPGAMGAGIDAG